MNKILIIEDEKSLNDNLKDILEKENYIVESAYTFEEAESLYKDGYDIFLIDINLGFKSGFELFKKMKKNINLEETVCIFLTARDAVSDNVLGLDLGADDYITKPFKVEVLLSKIRNLIRKKQKTSIISIGIYSLDTQKKILYKIIENTVLNEKKEIPLTFLEYEIIERFFEKQDWIISRDELKDLIYDKTDNFVNDNTISVYIKRIREKIGIHNGKYIIESVRGMGYRLSE